MGRFRQSQYTKDQCDPFPSPKTMITEQSKTRRDSHQQVQERLSCRCQSTREEETRREKRKETKRRRRKRLTKTLYYYKQKRTNTTRVDTKFELVCRGTHAKISTCFKASDTGRNFHYYRVVARLARRKEKKPTRKKSYHCHSNHNPILT